MLSAGIGGYRRALDKRRLNNTKIFELRTLFALCLVLVLQGCAATSQYSENEIRVVGEQNPLLMKIYRADPEKAKAFLAEIRSIDRSATDPETEDSNTEAIPERFYKEVPGSSSDQFPAVEEDASVSDLVKRRQADRLIIGRNPLLERLYSKSPLATLRMLQRMKEAANQP